MKFSYKLLKKLSPKIPDKAKFIDQFNLHAFETEDLGGDVLEISIPANRYSDAASHWGIAKIAAAIFGGKAEEIEKVKSPKSELKNTAPEIKISAKQLCPRYMGRYFEITKMGESPKWIQEALIANGMRPINEIVDAMNYVMLEVGQPLHAFDADLISGAIDVRLAKKGEKIETIDGKTYKLNGSELLIADDKGPLAIAGIKGGKRAEVNPHTKRIIVEAANFDPTKVYRTSRELNLFTDASSQFSHGLSPALVGIGMNRAAQLLKETANAKIGELEDISTYKPSKKILKFHINKFNSLTGLTLKEGVCLDFLKRLGFNPPAGGKGSFVEAPDVRTDIEIFEDLVEEIVNLYGYNHLPASAPTIALMPSGYEDLITLKDEVRRILIGFGLSEVYNYSFVAGNNKEELVEVANPISEDKKYLRSSLLPHLLKNIEDNLRFDDAVRIFELGKVFKKGKGIEENLMLGIAIGTKKENPFLELKGLVDQLLKGAGLVEFFMKEESPDILRLESDHQVLGYLKHLGNNAAVEINMDKLLTLVEEEKSYEPLPKFPSVMRDLSVFLPLNIRIGNALVLIESAAPKYLEDVDVIDIFEPPQKTFERKTGHGGGEPVIELKKSITFRMVFRADDRTLTDEEVGKEMEKIVAALISEFNAEIR